MPAQIYNLIPDGTEVFRRSVFPSGFYATTLSSENLGIGKLALVHCEHDDSSTLVFEREVPFIEVKDKESTQRAFDQFAKELDAHEYTAMVRHFGEYTAALRDESDQIIIGLSVRHNHYVNPN